MKSLALPSCGALGHAICSSGGHGCMRIIQRNYRLIDKRSERRYDDCLKYTMVGSKKALADAGLSRESNPEAFEKLDKARVGVLVGSGMGGLQVFQDGVTNLVQKVRLQLCGSTYASFTQCQSLCPVSISQLINRPHDNRWQAVVRMGLYGCRATSESHRSSSPTPSPIWALASSPSIKVLWAPTTPSPQHAPLQTMPTMQHACIFAMVRQTSCLRVAPRRRLYLLALAASLHAGVPIFVAGLVIRLTHAG